MNWMKIVVDFYLNSYISIILFRKNSPKIGLGGAHQYNQQTWLPTHIKAMISNLISALFLYRFHEFATVTLPINLIRNISTMQITGFSSLYYIPEQFEKHQCFSLFLVFLFYSRYILPLNLHKKRLIWLDIC